MVISNDIRLCRTGRYSFSGSGSAAPAGHHLKDRHTPLACDKSNEPEPACGSNRAFGRDDLHVLGGLERVTKRLQGVYDTLLSSTRR
jgi:hypothetical protein